MTRTDWITGCLRRLTPAVLAILTVAPAGCAAFRRSTPQPPAALVFSNESLQQVTVYAVAAGYARRIGTVMPGRTDTLMVPAHVANRSGMLNIVARLLAGAGTVQTGPVSLHPGERYRVRLPLDGRLLSFLPAPEP